MIDEIPTRLFLDEIVQYLCKGEIASLRLVCKYLQKILGKQWIALKMINRSRQRKNRKRLRERLCWADPLETQPRGRQTFNVTRCVSISTYSDGVCLMGTHDNFLTQIRANDIITNIETNGLAGYRIGSCHYFDDWPKMFEIPIQQGDHIPIYICFCPISQPSFQVTITWYTPTTEQLSLMLPMKDRFYWLKNGYMLLGYDVIDVRSPFMEHMKS